MFRNKPFTVQLRFTSLRFTSLQTMSFDWQTEEDVDWDDPIEAEVEPEKRRRRWPWAVLLLLLLLGTAVFVIVRTVYQRVEVATENVEDELLASVTVIQNAAANADGELFTSFLSGKDEDWATASENLVARDLYLQRPGFGLQWIEVDPKTAVISTTLSTELKQAEVLSEYEYELSVGDGFTDTIRLQKTAVYRLGPNRWLLAPPDGDFWGETLQIESKLFTLTYPERDDAIVQKLAADLEVELVGYCILMSSDCSDFNFNLEFSTNPDILEPVFPPQFNNAKWQLPTPTLVGLPIDQDGYDALYRGYATQLLTPLLILEHEAGCCGQLFIEVAISHVLQQLGIWSGEDTAVNWEALAENHTRLNQIDGNWDADAMLLTPQDYQLVKASLLFLIEEVGISPLELLQTLSQSTEATFFNYIIVNFAERYSPDINVWEREWRQFVIEQARYEQTIDPLPEQDLLMLCSPDWADKVALYRHDFASGATLLEQDFNYRYTDGLMIGLPDDSGIGMIGNNDAQETIGVFLLQENLRHDVIWYPETGEIPLSIPVRVSDAGGEMLWFASEESVDGLSYGVLDIDKCVQTNQCNLNLGTSDPTWSADGEQMIGLKVPFPFDMSQEELLTLRSGDGETLISALGFGATPFWIDDENFGYVQNGEFGRSQVFVSTLAENAEPELLISSNDFILALPDVAYPLLVDFAQLDPNDANILLMVVGYEGVLENGRFLLAYNFETGEMETRWTFAPEQNNFWRVYNFSTDYEWLLTNTILVDESNTDAYLFYHLQSGATITLPFENDFMLPYTIFADWSANGDWFAYPQYGMMQLFAPDEGTHYEIIADGLMCTNAVWVNKVTSAED